MTADLVNHPPHYTHSDIECIDAIRAALGTEMNFMCYCQGTAIKYLWRYRHKGGAEDLKKASWYLDRMIKSFDVIMAGHDAFLKNPPENNNAN
tara:strand:+ start:600 stop:878 length:279 start_codon:yes stop_codon:yes gene_type:complete